MPIYTASLFHPQHHHGRRVAVCRSLPPGAEVDRHLKFLAPPADLILDWNGWKQDELGSTHDRDRQYKERYWAHLVSGWDQLASYLDALPTSEVETWVTEVEPKAFCHRNLLLKLIERDWPQHLGRGGGAVVPFEIATPGIAWACKHFGLKPIFPPIVPSSPAAQSDSQESAQRANLPQLLFFPDVSNQ